MLHWRIIKGVLNYGIHTIVGVWILAWKIIVAQQNTYSDARRERFFSTINAIQLIAFKKIMASKQYLLLFVFVFLFLKIASFHRLDKLRPSKRI